MRADEPYDRTDDASLADRLFAHAHDPEPTCEGRTFPREHEWLSLPAPSIDDGFVDRTLRALAADHAAADEAAVPPDVFDGDHAAEPDADPATLAGHLVTPQLLRLFAAPEPSPDFVVTTLRAVQEDRRRRWRELLARYIAPEPSPEFVARTLRALANENGRSPAVPAAGRLRRVRGWLPLLALAAGAIAYALLDRSEPPLEARVAQDVPFAYAYGYAGSPLPAVLVSIAQDDDPLALPVATADGIWLRAPGGPR